MLAWRARLQNVIVHPDHIVATYAQKGEHPASSEPCSIQQPCGHVYAHLQQRKTNCNPDAHVATSLRSTDVQAAGCWDLWESGVAMIAEQDTGTSDHEELEAVKPLADDDTCKRLDGHLDARGGVTYLMNNGI